MQKTFVLPGDLVGSAEEFGAGYGTYVKGGAIYATTAGIVEIDKEKRCAYVIPKSNAPPTLSVGDIVVGRIIDLKESLAIIALSHKSGYESRPLPNTDATVHISNVKNAYVKDIRQVFGLQDIIRAKIVDDSQLRLTTADDDLGVLKAYCSKCTTALVKENGKLVCPSCKHTEMRKISSNYGLGVIQ
jgi:exosome complex component CSL4